MFSNHMTRLRARRELICPEYLAGYLQLLWSMIAKITLPKQAPDTGERDYLKAFRPLRPEEFTRMADVQALRKALSVDGYHLFVQLDYETSERAGAGGMFQVISVNDEDGKDFTHLVDQGWHYASLDEIRKDLARNLEVDVHQVKLEEV